MAISELNKLPMYHQSSDDSIALQWLICLNSSLARNGKECLIDLRLTQASDVGQIRLKIERLGSQSLHRRRLQNPRQTLAQDQLQMHAVEFHAAGHHAVQAAAHGGDSEDAGLEFLFAAGRVGVAAEQALEQGAEVFDQRCALPAHEGGQHRVAQGGQVQFQVDAGALDVDFLQQPFLEQAGDEIHHVHVGRAFHQPHLADGAHVVALQQCAYQCVLVFEPLQQGAAGQARAFGDELEAGGRQADLVDAAFGGVQHFVDQEFFALFCGTQQKDVGHGEQSGRGLQYTGAGLRIRWMARPG